MTNLDLIQRENTVLRDQLAALRTHLANERTLLAYVRTGLACFVTGLGGLHLLESSGWLVVAWGLVGCGPTLWAFGAWRFARCRRLLAQTP